MTKKLKIKSLVAKRLAVRDRVKDLLHTLPEREKKVLKLRYGIGCVPHTLAAIGKIMNLTRERVRQIEGYGLNGSRFKGVNKNMREKTKMNKNCKILIRVSPDEKNYALAAAEDEDKNISELLRNLLRDHEKDKILELIIKIAKRNERLFKKYKSAMDIMVKVIRNQVNC
jgi:hypothetical protein